MKRINFSKINHCLIVAEVSANHCQDLELAIKLVEKAKECGADAVKFQAYTPDTLTIDASTKYFRINHPKWGGQSLYQLYKKAYTPWNWFKKLKKRADSLGLLFFATAYDRSSVDFLQDLGVPLHKVASFELVDIPLIEYLAKTRKPLILSTGMASQQEIKDAVNAARGNGTKEIMLLKCVSAYPAKPEDMNLLTIPDLRKKFQCPVGLSDHTLSTAVAIASVVLGVKLIEKHFCLSRKYKSADSFFSLEPEDLKQLVSGVRTAEKSLGKIYYGLTADQKNNRIFRRSLFAIQDIKKGDFFTENNIQSIRPGFGLAPKYLKEVIGKKAKTSIKRGMPLMESLLGK
ncbi:MAG: pseudaminic acid synthase [Candidatus Omnitrophica bacterium]|nr:pseudaminic acid synthase [Candidatus Omnitrophota bacterium]